MAKSLKDLASLIGNAFFSATPVGQAYNATQRAVPIVQNSISQFAQNYPRASQVISRAEPAYNQMQSFVRSIPSQPFQYQANTPYKPVNSLLNLGANIALSIPNAPFQAFKSAYQFPQSQNKREAIGNAAGLVNAALAGSVPKGIANVGGKIAAQPRYLSPLQKVGSSIVSGAKTGSQFGGFGGLMTGLEQGKDLIDPGEYVRNLLGNTATGVAAGAALGGALGGVSSGVKQTTEWMQGQARTQAQSHTKKIMLAENRLKPQWARGLTQDQVEKKLYEYYKVQMNQGGFVKPDEFIPKKKDVTKGRLGNEPYGSISPTSGGTFVAYDPVRKERLYEPGKGANIKQFKTEAEAQAALDKLQASRASNVANGRLSDVYKGKEFSFVRNPEKAPNVGNRFGQNIEPAGKYMNLMEEGQTYTPPGWETGKVKFNNPLVIDWGEGYQSGNNWKNVLSKQYGGKTGKALSDAIRKDGYDGIITLDKGKPSEVVSLVKPNVAQPPVSSGRLSDVSPFRTVYRGEDTAGKGAAGSSFMGKGKYYAENYNTASAYGKVKEARIDTRNFIKADAVVDKTVAGKIIDSISKDAQIQKNAPKGWTDSLRDGGFDLTTLRESLYQLGFNRDDAGEVIAKAVKDAGYKGIDFPYKPSGQRAYVELADVAQPPVSDAQPSLNIKKSENIVPGLTEKNLGIGEEATPIPLEQNKGVVGQPTASQFSKTGTVPTNQAQKASIEGNQLVRDALLSGDETAAKALYKDLSVDTKLAPFDQLKSETSSVMSTEMKAAQSQSSSSYGEYDSLVKKMKSFLRVSGENKSKETGELFREHIPKKIFGVSSDEVSVALGKTESEFMADITKDLNMMGSPTTRPQAIASLRQKVEKLKSISDTLDPEFYKVIKEWDNSLRSISAQATPKTLEKIRIRDMKAEEKAAKAEFDAWQRQYRSETVSPSQRMKSVEQSIKTNTASPVSKNPETLNDISGWQGYMRDVYRNFKAVYGDRFDEAKRVMLDPFDRSKGQYVDMTESWAKKLKTGIVDRFNIRKGSKESAAVQQYGEGILSDTDLVSRFGAKKAQEIKAADQWFRSAYNELIDTVNATRKRIYPNNPEKWVAKRQDYYRHFREMKEGLGALFNIFDSPSSISSTLAGISEGTKPKAKFLSIAQQRKGEKTTYDAVGGFIDYIKQASYATNIDPHIERFRNLSKELGESTAESKNLNTFVSYLSRFADDLSGKTNAADRFAQEIIPGGRTTFRAINWLNNRTKANAVIGNASSALSQIMNVPQGLADAGVPNGIKGIGRTLAGIFADNPVIKKSTFLRERYSDPFSQFDTGIINNVGKFAKWMTGALDNVGSRIIWNSQYEKALKSGVGDAVKFADDATRALVAGRGIGEVPLLQKSRLMQMVAPFQLEVQNLWWVLKDMKDQKAFGKIAVFFVVNHIMNKAIEGIRGSDVTFDPIQSTIDGYKSFQEEEDKGKGLVKFAGRQAGEVLSNVPFGQTIASLYPEYGATIGDTKLPTRRDLFGKGNPVRQGSGLIAVEGLKDPLYKIIPPYGGAQLKKTIEGLQSVGQGFVGKPDAVKYPVEQSAGNVVRGAVFGKGALPETKTYYDEDRRPLGEKQSAVYLASSDKQNAYKTVIDKRKEDALDEKAKEELKSRGGGSLEKNGKVYLLKDNGDVNTIDPSFQPTKPTLTGQTELDKKLISKFNGQITSKANDIVDLYESGKLSQQEAEKQLDALKALKSSYSTKKSGSAKKISIKKITPKTIRVSMPKASKIQTIKVPKAPSFKKSTSRKAIKITAGKPIKYTKIKGLTSSKKLV